MRINVNKTKNRKILIKMVKITESLADDCLKEWQPRAKKKHKLNNGFVGMTHKTVWMSKNAPKINFLFEFHVIEFIDDHREHFAGVFSSFFSFHIFSRFFVCCSSDREKWCGTWGQTRFSDDHLLWGTSNSMSDKQVARSSQREWFSIRWNQISKWMARQRNKMEDCLKGSFWLSDWLWHWDWGGHYECQKGCARNGAMNTMIVVSCMAFR